MFITLFSLSKAKSAKSMGDFYKIHDQMMPSITVLPSLQRRLQNKANERFTDQEPILCYFANRGSVWMLPACFSTITILSEAIFSALLPLYVDIFVFTSLWVLSISEYLTNHKYLRNYGKVISRRQTVPYNSLILIDYLAVWAMAIYRPRILQQLTTIAEGATYD